MAKYDEKGREILDPQPLAVPAGFKKPAPLADQVRRLVRAQLSDIAASQGYESFEEADDFDVDDEPLLQSDWETVFDPELGKEMTRLEHAEVERSRREFDKQAKAQEKRRKTLARKRALRDEETRELRHQALKRRAKSWKKDE